MIFCKCNGIQKNKNRGRRREESKRFKKFNIYYKHELKLLIRTIRMTMGKEEIKNKGEKEEGIKKESRCVICMYLLPKMNVNSMYCNHVLIKIIDERN